MLSRIREILTAGPPADEVAGLEKIQVATGVLLLELAAADGDFHQAEAEQIEVTLKERFALSRETLDELLALAHQERQESLDLHQFTTVLNDEFSIAEKIRVLEELWRVVYADGAVDRYEEYLMRQLTHLLRLSHRQMIDTKLKVRDQMLADS